MSLATRCTACGTVFRVVQDQLKVSEGWVRCGRCNEVFNALEGLFDLEREAPPEGAAIHGEPEPASQPGAEPAGRPAAPPDVASASAIGAARAPAERPDRAPERASTRPPPPAPAPPAASATTPLPMASGMSARAPHAGGIASATATPAQASPATAAAPPADAFFGVGEGHTMPNEPPPAPRIDPSLDERIDEDLFGSRPGEPDTMLAQAFDDPRIGAEFGAGHLDPELLTDEAALLASRGVSERPPSRKRRKRRDSKPGFVREAERQARWQRPGVRMMLGLVAAALAALLAMQVTLHWRDTVAVRWPMTRPALQQWCAWTGCTLEAPRRIEDIFVESTTLARNPNGDGFRLAVNLRNRGTLPLAVPAVDLNLTDASGQLVARRVLFPRDFGVKLAALPAGGDTSLQLSLSTGPLQVTGYTVEIFYP